ncbi:MAG: DUF1320 family protein [Lentisphaeria bacterium]|nr:DUF1320 family protein [Lentisphaeria bacterium]
MSYASAEELRQRIGGSVFDEIYNLSEPIIPAESSDEAGSEQAEQIVLRSSSSDEGSDITDDLESAAAEIDGAIAARYALPVTGSRSLALLKDWNLTLAEERAYARPAGADFSEKIKRRVDQVRKYLDLIRNDQFRLPDAAENSSGSGSTIALVQRDDPVFDRDKMGGF